MKPSPGPWKVRGFDHHWLGYSIEMGDSDYTMVWGDHNEANALLVSLAPALVAMLRRAVEIIEEETETPVKGGRYGYFMPQAKALIRRVAGT